MDFKWTIAAEEEAIRILGNDDVEVPHNRRYYRIHQNFQLIEIAGVHRVQRKRDQKLMATLDRIPSIIRDIHQAIEPTFP